MTKTVDTCNVTARTRADADRGVVTSSKAIAFVRSTCPCARCKADRDNPIVPDPETSTDAELAPFRGTTIHARDCDGPEDCGGVYTCPRCERAFGWCCGAYDDTPALCDDCANAIQADDTAPQQVQS